VLHVRVVAPLEPRILYVMHREGLDYEAARSRVQLKDRDRDRYLQAAHHHDPDDPHLYDLVVNTGIIDLDGIVHLVNLALEYKAKKLSVPTQELGPAAGLARYPGQVADFRPPESMTELQK
jgi:CMP/dCMP kinase